MRLISDDEIHRRFKEGVTAYYRGDYRSQGATKKMQNGQVVKAERDEAGNLLE